MGEVSDRRPRVRLGQETLGEQMGDPRRRAPFTSVCTWAVSRSNLEVSIQGGTKFLTNEKRFSPAVGRGLCWARSPTDAPASASVRRLSANRWETLGEQMGDPRRTDSRVGPGLRLLLGEVSDQRPRVRLGQETLGEQSLGEQMYISDE